MSFPTCWGWRKAPQKAKERWCKGSAAKLKESTQLGWASQDSYPRKSILRERGKLRSKHTVKFTNGHLAPNQKSGKKGSIGRSCLKVRTSWAQHVCSQIWGTTTWGDPAPWKMRPQSSMGFGETYLQAQECGQSSVFSSIEATVMPAPTSKSPEERDFVVDSGAPMHMMSKEELSSEEMDTARRSRPPTEVSTANGEVQTHEEAQVFVHDLYLFVTVQLLDGYTCSLIAKQALQRPRTLLWVGQRSKATIDQKREDYHLQNRQCRTSCRSRVVHQSWK